MGGGDANRVLSWPLNLFWSAVRSIDRLKADDDLRALNVALTAAVTAVGDQDMIKAFRSQLLAEKGMVVLHKQKVSSPSEIMAALRN